MEELRPQYQLTDHLGNVVVLFEDKNDNGAITSEISSDDDQEIEVIERMLYYPFGMRLLHTYKNQKYPGSLRTNYQYNGKEFDEEIELYDYSARWYDARIGRFMSVDPLADQYPSHTPYHYVLNNPLRFTDPTGMRVEIDDLNGAEGKRDYQFDTWFSLFF